jgi:hypothetical protein
MKADREETMACKEMTEVCLECKDLNSKEMEFGVGHREVPKEHVAVKSIGRLRKEHRCQNLAADRLNKPKGRIVANCGFQKKLPVSDRKMTHLAGLARRKGHGR